MMTTLFLLFIGTYTQQDSQGIYVSRFNAEHGTLEVSRLAFECDNPTFLALHPTKPYLYAIGKFPKGMVSAFHYDHQTGRLELLNEQEIPGHGPCHLTVCHSDTGDAVVVANYGSGCLASFPISSDGKIGAVASHITHTGSGPNTARQEAPHVHGVYYNVYSGGSTIAVVDLGIDTVVYYAIDLATAQLSQSADCADLCLAPGAGPRHLAVSKDQRLTYVVNELDSTVSVFDRQTPGDAIRSVAVQSVSTLTEGKDAAKLNNSTAEIALHQSEKFLYASNRGDDSIAVFAVEDGKLTLIQTMPSGGKTPRFFCLDPTGKFLLACNQDSGNVCVFAVDQTTGKLTPTEQSIKVPLPTCLVFAP